MTPQQLKNSILQLAIQGKLVEQRPEEGTAKELLQEISEEKGRLIREGKIKKAKPLPEISEDEIPFEVPESWEWVRLGDIGVLERGSGLKRNEITPQGMPCIRYGELYTTYRTRFDLTVSYTSPEIFAQCHKVCKNDIVMSLTGENKHDIAMAVTYEGDSEIAMGGDMTKWFAHGMNPIYLTYLLNSPYGIGCKQIRATGNIIVHISNGKLSEIPLPIPPLAEQHRIVSKIEELLPYIGQYDKAYTKLNEWNEKFPEAIKKSILQYAMEGKLVEQRPEEGTAEELLREIRAEKERLVKEGKIKKTKPLPEISEDEIPFEVPKSWMWVRLGEIFYLQAGKSLPSSEIRESKENEYVHPCYGGNGLRGYVSQFNREGFYPLIGRQGALCGNINLATGKFYATEHAVVTETFSGTDIKWAGMFLKALNLNQYATATAQPGLAVKNLNSVLIPLPPVKEQKRIVDRVEELFCIICNERALR